MFPFTHGIIASSSAGTVAPSTEFIIRVKTDNAGTSASNQFTIPTTGGGYNYSIETSEHSLTGETGSVTLTFSTAGTYDITITGTFPRIFFNNTGDKLKLVRTINLGDVGWTTFAAAFFGCINNVIESTATGVFTGVTDYYRAWYLNNLTTFPNLDLSSGTNFDQTWRENNFTTFPNLDLSSGNNFFLCFYNCGTISNFALRNFYAMTSGSRMFELTTIPTSDCSDIYITQRANNVNTGVSLHMGNSKYNTAGGVARGELVSIQSWSITDGGAE